MKTQIKVTYQGPLDVKTDIEIGKKLESIGAKWWAQGTDCETQIRDLRFDLEV